MDRSICSCLGFHRKSGNALQSARLGDKEIHTVVCVCIHTHQINASKDVFQAKKNGRLAGARGALRFPVSSVSAWLKGRQPGETTFFEAGSSWDVVT